MKWKQVEHALQFLENPTDGIVLQVPYSIDISRVQDYIVSQHAHELGITCVHARRLITKKGTIVFEFVDASSCGIGYSFPCFLIERANGDTGLDAVDHDSFEQDEKESSYEETQEQEGRDHCSELSGLCQSSSDDVHR